MIKLVLVVLAVLCCIFICLVRPDLEFEAKIKWSVASFFISLFLSTLFYAFFSTFLPDSILLSYWFSILLYFVPAILVTFFCSFYFILKHLRNAKSLSANTPASVSDKFADESTSCDDASPSPDRVEWVPPPDLPEPGEPSSTRPLTADERLRDVDNLDGPAFEKWCSELLGKAGFVDIHLTKSSGDQGVDIIAVKDEIRYAFQCKCYSSDLGNHPVQEVHAGKSLYNCHVGVVVTNRYFTSGAKELAKATGTLLWDRDKLKSMIQTVYN